MDIYFTIEEKYLEAVEEYNYGEPAKALQLLNEIININPLYARAHYYLGLINYYLMKDYQTAGYHLQLCIEQDAAFPDAYIPYLSLLVLLNKAGLATTVSKNALNVPGVDQAAVYNLLGLQAERRDNWLLAKEMYRKALLTSNYKKQLTEMEENMDRVALKIKSTRAYVYDVAE